VIGVDDPHFYGCDDLEEALEAVPEDDFKVLLAHTPEIFEKAARSGIHLYLCGHTHAGQIRLPIIGEVLQNTDCPRAYAQGEWRHDRMLGHTSAGVGCSVVPVRYKLSSRNSRDRTREKVSPARPKRNSRPAHEKPYYDPPQPNC